MVVDMLHTQYVYRLYLHVLHEDNFRIHIHILHVHVVTCNYSTIVLVQLTYSYLNRQKQGEIASVHLAPCVTIFTLRMHLKLYTM